MAKPYLDNNPIEILPKGETAKIALSHNGAEIQKLMDDITMHICYCKQISWNLKTVIKAATGKTELDDYY